MRLAKCLPYYAHLEIELFVRKKNYFVSYFSIIQLNKVIQKIIQNEFITYVCLKKNTDVSVRIEKDVNKSFTILLLFNLFFTKKQIA